MSFHVSGTPCAGGRERANLNLGAQRYELNIKTAGLTAYTQVSHLVETSKEHSLIEKQTLDVNELFELISKPVEE